MRVTTLTSKNQITIPAELVRQLGLGRHRKLRIERQGDDALLLTLQKDLRGQLNDIQRRAQPYVKRSLSDTELAEARTEAWSARKGNSSRKTTR
jgi:bifunctional DNA-binding transcriptional regulator/antitoxin component of YhaV-PrlF toxin-antitoxin module